MDKLAYEAFQHLPKDPEDIERSTTLYPGAYIDLKDSQSPRRLHHFHKFSGSNLVRGVDSNSRTAFLSMHLYGVNTPDSLLLICHFNASGLDHVGTYRAVYQPDNINWQTSSVELKCGPMDIDRVRKVLVDKYLDLRGYDRLCYQWFRVNKGLQKMWTMEGKYKRHYRRTTHAVKYQLPPLLICVSSIILVVVVAVLIAIKAPGAIAFAVILSTFWYCVDQR